MELSASLVAALVFLIVFLWFRHSDPNLPPCPLRPLPIIGHLLFLNRDTRIQFKQWRKQCGDIFSLHLGGTLVVVLNGYDLIKEALVKNADVFSDRPYTFADLSIGMKDKGVVSSNGAVWKEQRTVSVAILRNFGMGKNLLAEKIQEEVGFYINYLASLQGNPTDLRISTNISTCNIICSILIGRRFDYDCDDFKNLMSRLNALLTEVHNTSVINFMFWLRYVPGDLFKAKRLTEHRRTIFRKVKTFIEEKKRNITNSHDVRNFIDAYIAERNKKMQDGIPTSLDDENLAKLMLDLFLAGTSTTSTTIYWCILYMLHNPGVQEKVYQEIKDNVGTDRFPNMQDKANLTYLNAVIKETQRLGSIIPLSVTHMCSKNVSLRGYTLPKGTYVLPHLDSVLHDKTTWGEDAMSFRPERFIDNNGKLKNPEQFIPFSMGRRFCLGQEMATMELFLLLSSLFQRFHFLSPTPHAIPYLHYECGILASPKPYEVIIAERK